MDEQKINLNSITISELREKVYTALENIIWEYYHEEEDDACYNIELLADAVVEKLKNNLNPPEDKDS